MKTLGSIIVGGVISLSSAAYAESGCVIEEAAQAALDRQIQTIEAAQTDVGSFFSGTNSCINSNLLNIIDFSSVIPDLGSLVASIGQDAVNQILNDAVQQACDIANEQIGDVTNGINTSLVSWRSDLSDEVGNIISDGQITLQ